MPRYFFSVSDGISIPDHEGTELSDIDRARLEALRMSGELLREMGTHFWDGHEWKLEVSDESGRILFVVRITGEEHPAPPGDTASV